jgi:uncharacterized membrane protein HdeD (DUF308 family)
MLRSVVLIAGGLCFAAGLIALFAGIFPPAFVFVFWGGLLIIGTIYERVRYKAVQTTQPGPEWVKTSERFYDDETGKLITVYIRPETGERSYVEQQ